MHRAKGKGSEHDEEYDAPFDNYIEYSIGVHRFTSIKYPVDSLEVSNG